MPGPDQQADENESLTRKIEELDSLIRKNDNPAAPIGKNDQSTKEPEKRQKNIPVLDKLVTAEDFLDQPVVAEDDPKFTAEEVAELMGTMELKFADELDKLVREIKKGLSDELAENFQTRLQEIDNRKSKDI